MSWGRNNRLHLIQNEKYQISVELDEFLSGLVASECEQRLENNLDFLSNLSCHAYGKIIKIIFNPPAEVTDEYVFNLIEETLLESSLTFVRAVIRMYVGNAARTIAASVTGGAIGSRGGAVGALIGLIAGAAIEKALFDWKDVCECGHDEFGQLVITRFGNSENA